MSEPPLTAAELEKIRKAASMMPPDYDIPILLATIDAQQKVIDHLASVIHQACAADEQVHALARHPEKVTSIQMQRAMERREAAWSALFAAEEEYHRERP